MNVRTVSSASPWEAEFGYARAVRVGDRVLVGGTVAVGDDGACVAPGDAYRQALRCWEIIGSAVEGLGGSRSGIVSSRAFVTDIADCERVGRAHAELFGGHPFRPLLTVIGCSSLVGEGFVVEIEAEALVE